MPEGTAAVDAGRNPPIEYVVAVWLGMPRDEIAQGLRELNLDDVATKQDISQLRLEIRDVRIDILKWMIPLMLGQIVAASVAESLALAEVRSLQRSASVRRSKSA